MTRNGMVPAERRFLPSSLLLAALLAFVVLILRIAAIESPLMASDEYAYFASAQYEVAPERLQELDPFLQDVQNRVYPALYAAWAAVSPNQPALVGRILNALGYVLGAFLLYALYLRVFDRRAAIASALLYLMLPMSMYATTVLPEVESQLSFYLVAGVVVVAGVRPRYHFIAASAALCALSYFIKPHAAALILACAAYWFASGLLERDVAPGLRWRRAMARAAWFSGLAVLLIVAVSRLVPAGMSSESGVMPVFYLAYVERLFDVAFLVSVLAGIGKYVGGHLWLLFVLFAPGLVAISRLIAGLRRGMDSRDEADDEAHRVRAHFALFVGLCLFAYLIMVALFTSSAASDNALEAGRLHGRYLAGLLPLLLAYSVWASGRDGGHRMALLGITALSSFMVFGTSLYQLFPWDYPDAFGFFRPPLHGWTFEGAMDWPVWWVLAVGVACWLSALRMRGARWPFIVFTLTWMLAAQIQTWRWSQFQSAQTRPIVAASAAIKNYLGEVPAGSGLIATDDRYGKTSALLMALHSPQHVRTFPAAARLRRTDIPAGVGWVVAPKSMEVAIAGAAELVFGDLRLALLDHRHAWPYSGQSGEWDGRPIQIDTATKGQISLLHGFNDAEEWGSWTGVEDAFVQLPVRIDGPVVLDFFAWQVEDHPDFMLRVTLGDAVSEIRLAAIGRDYRVALHPTHGDDRIRFETKLVQHAGEPRALGVALARLRVSRDMQATPAATLH